MRLTRHHLTILAVAFGTILGTTLFAPSAAALESHRGLKWQFSIPMTFTTGGSVDGGNGSSVDISDDLGWGFGFGYNLDERFLVGMEFTWLNASYDASVASDINNDQVPDLNSTVSGTLDASSIQFFAQYNILPKTVTPFLRVSIGSTWIDSNIPSGPPQGTCWWDPWYGYICNSWQPTFEDTVFSYGAAAGVRADVNPQFFIEGSYNILWLDFDHDTPSMDGFRLNLGWSF